MGSLFLLAVYLPGPVLADPWHVETWWDSGRQGLEHSLRASSLGSPDS